MYIRACSVYAQAFREGFTVTLVSGRTVGIGAYLARLGRRYPFCLLHIIFRCCLCDVISSVTSDSSHAVHSVATCHT